MSGILRLESLTKGNTLKQGDKTPLKYRLFDADGEKLNIAGKSAKVRLVYPDFLTIGYEKDGLTVTQDDTVTFTIDSVIPPRIYHVEIIVDEQFVFPSRADEAKFTVDKSSLGADTNIIEIIGKDVLIQEVKSQVDTELQPLVTSLESAEQAEAQRATAESDRVSAEAQRKTDHANRSAELDGKADKVALKNLVENGDFIDGVKNIQLSQGARIENQKLIYAHGTSGSTIRWFTKRLNTDLYYFYIKYNTNETTNAYQLANNQGNVYSINSSSTFHSHRRTYPSPATLSIYGGQNATHDLVVDYYVALNLTETFGTGNEPTKEEMDELIKIAGYIDGEYALNNKEMLIWTLALIRRNKNAIVALGGA